MLRKGLNTAEEVWLRTSALVQKRRLLMAGRLHGQRQIGIRAGNFGLGDGYVSSGKQGPDSYKSAPKKSRLPALQVVKHSSIITF